MINNTSLINQYFFSVSRSETGSSYHKSKPKSIITKYFLPGLILLRKIWKSSWRYSGRTLILNFRKVPKTKISRHSFCMVHGGNTNVRLAITIYEKLKKACKFLFLKLAGSSELTSFHCTLLPGKSPWFFSDFLLQFWGNFKTFGNTFFPTYFSWGILNFIF